MIINLTSSYNVISKVIRDYGLRENEGTLIEWIGEGLEHIGINSNWCEEAVAFSTVESHQCEFPSHCRSIIQIAKNNTYSSPAEVTGSLETSEETEGEPVPIDENGQPLSTVNYAYYRPYFDYIYQYQFWYQSPFYTQKFTPIRLANHSFYNSIVCEDTNIIYDNDALEYTVVPAIRSLRFSFIEGQVAIAYLKQKLDDEGYPLIPDDISYISALSAYIIYRKTIRDFYNHVQGSTDIMLKSEEDWSFYCRQAKNKFYMPLTIDDYENLKNKRTYKLPTDRYKSFFK